MIEPPGPPAISLAAVQRALSESRFAAYRTHPDEPLEAVLGRYRWNAALCMALYPALGLLEVSLRNNLHAAITGYYGTAAWYDLTPEKLAPREQESIRQAKNELRKQGKREEPNRVVAELNFGFWTSLLSKEYEQQLWPRLLIPAFPQMPKRARTRARVAERLHEVRWLRNRVSHHEPIYKLASLGQRYSNIHEAISWLAPALLRLLPVGEDFSEIHARGFTAYELRSTSGCDALTK